jgi:hypothetical protein
MGLRAPAKWKKYRTGLFPWQLPNQVIKAALAALCPSSPRFARCAKAHVGHSIPLRAIKSGATNSLSCLLSQIWAQSSTIKGALYVQNSNFDHGSVGSHAEDLQIDEI